MCGSMWAVSVHLYVGDGEYHTSLDVEVRTMHHPYIQCVGVSTMPVCVAGENYVPMCVN